MIKLIKKWLKTLLNDKKHGRNIDVYESDIFLVSYPKSGNTWLRFLIGNVLYGDYNFGNMEKYIPDIYVLNNKFLKKTPSPRILKSHEYFDPRYKKIIYVVRDPRSVIISYFEYLKKMKHFKNGISLDSFITLFINGGIDRYGSWLQHVNSWVATNKKNENFLLVRYEDLKRDTIQELEKIMIFLELEYTQEKLRDSVLKSSFENMRKSEVDNKGKIEVLKKSKSDMPFMRKGLTNEWENYFSHDQKAVILEAFKETMELTGYDGA